MWYLIVSHDQVSREGIIFLLTLRKIQSQSFKQHLGIDAIRGPLGLGKNQVMRALQLNLNGETNQTGLGIGEECGILLVKLRMMLTSHAVWVCTLIE